MRVEVGERSVEPGQPFPEAAPRLPQRLQRGRQRQRRLDIAVFEAPRERSAQIVDLKLGLVEKPLIIIACQRVEHGRQRRVVIPVTRPHGVRLAGLPEFLQRVLAHRFEQAVSRSAPSVFGDH